MSTTQTSVSGDGRSPASRYADEFKRDAVHLVSQEKHSFKAAATMVNVSEKSLREWCPPRHLLATAGNHRMVISWGT